MINNAAKYSGCSNVEIKVTGNKQVLKLEIADNGKGFDNDRIRAGNGLRNIQTRAKDMDAYSLVFYLKQGREPVCN